MNKYPTRPTVVHVGPAGDQPGGMAQVVNRYLAWATPSLSIVSIQPTRYRHDPLSPPLTVAAALKLLRLSLSTSRLIAVFHLSERGSFVREGLLLLFTRRVLRVVTIAHLHGADFESFAQRHSKVVKGVLAGADAILALTADTTELVQRLIPQAAIRTIPNFVDVPSALPVKERIVLFAGEVGERKGFDVLLEAWRNIEDKVNGWTLLVAGPIRMSQAPTSNSSLQMLGAIPTRDLAQLYARASIFVLPSRAEALPMALLEAMGAGCTPIVSRAGSMPAVVNDDRGIVTDTGDTHDLEQALWRLINHADTRARMSRNSREYVRSNYSTEVGQIAMVDIWTSVERPRGRSL